MLVVPGLNQKGGVGKSTTNANLAEALARRKKKVLVIDTDPQGTLTIGTLDQRPAEGTAEVLGYGDAAAPLLEIFERVVAHSDRFGVDVLPADYNRLTQQSLALSVQPDLAVRLADLMAVVEDRYDFVLIDCGPNLGPLTMSALYACDGVFVAVETAEESTDGLGLLIRTLEGAKRLVHRDFKIYGAALTKFVSGQKMCEDVKAGLDSSGLFPWVQPIALTTAFKSAFSARSPLRAIAKDKAHKRAVADIDSLADHLEAISKGQAA